MSPLVSISIEEESSDSALIVKLIVFVELFPKSRGQQGKYIFQIQCFSFIFKIKRFELVFIRILTSIAKYVRSSHNRDDEILFRERDLGNYKK